MSFTRPMKIAFRADSGRVIGLGHLGRCVAIAQAFARLGEKPVFLDVARDCLPWLKERGFSARSSGSERWNILVGDNYRFTPRHHAENRRMAETLVLFDDFGTLNAPCDWILSSHVYAPGMTFQANNGRGFLVGPKFHPMRKEYWAARKPKEIAPRIRDLLIVLGGGDGWGLAAKAVETAARALPHARIHVVLGPLASPLRSDNPKVIAYRDLPHLRTIIEKADAAVSAGGQTLYELAFIGTPTVAVNLGKDQGDNIDGLERAGAAVSIGQGTVKNFSNRLKTELRNLDARPALRRRMSEAGRALLDGRGAIRVAKVLLEAR